MTGTPLSIENPTAAQLEFRTAEVVINKVQEFNTTLSAGAASVPAVLPRTHHSLLVLFTIMWAGNFVLAEVALHELSPISFSVSRFLMAGIVLLLILFVQSRRTGHRSPMFPRVSRTDWPRLVVVSLIGAAFAPWLGIEGLNLTSGGRASLWLALCPVLSASLGYFMKTESLGRYGVVGLVIAGVGTFGLAADGLGTSNQYWLGDLLLITAMACTILELHLIKPLVNTYGPTGMVTARTLIGGCCYLLLASSSLVQQNWLDLSGWTWIAIIIGGGIGVGIGQWVKVRALRTLGPTRVVLYGNLVPPVTLLLAWITLGNEPSMLEILAGTLIILGALCIQVVDQRRIDAQTVN
ncbi:MAG: DMT family transporter [Bacteroidota bacterium]